MSKLNIEISTEDEDDQKMRELLSRLRDIERRIGVACHPDWIRGQLDSLIRHYERSLLTSGREARVNE